MKEETVRLNKFLAEAGVCSRREADRCIEQGLVLVDGKRAEVGMHVKESQHITFKGKEIKRKGSVFNSFIWSSRDLTEPEVVLNVPEKCQWLMTAERV